MKPYTTNLHDRKRGSSIDHEVSTNRTKLRMTNMLMSETSQACPGTIAFPTLPEDFLVLLLFLRTNKPIRINLLSISLEDFRGPRKTVFLPAIVRS